MSLLLCQVLFMLIREFQKDLPVFLAQRVFAGTDVVMLRTGWP